MTLSLDPNSLSTVHQVFGETLGRIGSLEVRLARNSSEISAAQDVRFKVFYDELGARRSYVHVLEQRDSDRFDAFCDHLIVLDDALPGPDHCRVVGTYRLMEQGRAADAGGFYSEDEFALGALIERHPGKRFLELGRSCVLPQWRTRRTTELLWQGIWAYALRRGIDVMVGCGSFPGTVPAAHAVALSYLHHHHRARGAWKVRALPSRSSTMDLVPPEALDLRAALAGMPPLIKGYLRIGAMVGEGCVVDRDFATTDVFIVMPVANISERYIRYYGADAGRFAA